MDVNHFILLELVRHNIAAILYEMRKDSHFK